VLTWPVLPKWIPILARDGSFFEQASAMPWLENHGRLLMTGNNAEMDKVSPLAGNPII
jgi:hypothetical protein